MSYTPAGMQTTSPGLAHIAGKVYYNRTALDRLMKKFRFCDAFDNETMPKQEGRVVTMYRYQNMSASTVPTAEGTVGTSLTVNSRTVSATLTQFANYINLSDFLVDTAYDPQVNHYAELLGYRAGLSVDTMFRNIIDAQAASTVFSPLGSVFTVEDLRGVKAVLSANDVEPFDDGFYFCIMHPFITFDLVNDPTANGLADINKYQMAGGGAKNSPLLKQEDRGWVADIATTRILESTNVFTNSGQYRTYIFGKGGLKKIDLAGRGPSKVTDPKTQKFKINVVGRQGATLYDPEGKIGGAVSYNFVTTGCFVEGPAGIGGVYRSRTIDQVSTLG
jgi:N4-gp56 family major capsid protein